MVNVGLMSFAHLHQHCYAACLKEHPGATICGVFDEDEERGKQMAESLGTDYFADQDALLAQPIDAVVICSENAKHCGMAVAAANAGKHILCEKPIATTLEDAQTMIDTAQENGVRLMIAFPCRYAPSLIRVKEMVNEGKFGKVLAIRTTNHGSMPGGFFPVKELSGGGAVMDHTVHVADLIRWIFGIEAIGLYAEIDRRFYDDIDTEDCGMLNIEYEGGVIVSHDPSWSRLPCYPTWGDVTMEVLGDKGIVYVDAFNQKMTLYSMEETHATWVNWGDDMDMGLISDFVTMVETKGEPPITGYDGYKALEVTMAAYRSGETGKKVSLPLQD